MQLQVSWDTVYAEGVIACSPGLRCESELPWVRISPTNDLPPKGLLPTGKVFVGKMGCDLRPHRLTAHECQNTILRR